MKMFRKTLSIVMVILTVLMCLSVSAFAADTTVKLRIEGVDKCYFYGDVKVADGATALDVLKAADAADDSLTVTIVESEYGLYLSAINGVYAGSYTEKMWDGWSYRVNDVAPTVGVDAYEVSDGDSMVMYYNDEWNTGMQYPVAKTDKLSEGKIYFTSMDTVYDENWNATVAECAVTGYTLIWDGKKITPDAEGVCTIDASLLTAGKHTVQIEKYDAKTGLPTVLRFAPDFTVTVEGSEAEKSFFDMIKDFFMSIIEFFRNLFKF